MLPFPCGWWTCTIILFDYFNLSLINSFCINWFSLLLLINSFNIIWFSLLITHQLLLYYLIIPIIYYASSQFVFIYLFLSLSHFSFWMAYANAIYHSSLIIYYSSTLLYYLIITIITLIISVCFILFFPHIFHLMADANDIYHFILIICYSWTHYYPSTVNTFFSFFLILFFFFLWLTLCSFHPFFYLVLLSFSLASIQLFHPTHGLFCFILCYLSWGYTFYIMFIPHCKYFFLSSCTRNMAHNAVNTRSQSLLHRKYTCTRPVRQMPFGVTTLKIEDWRDTTILVHGLFEVCTHWHGRPVASNVWLVRPIINYISPYCVNGCRHRKWAAEFYETTNWRLISQHGSGYRLGGQAQF